MQIMFSNPIIRYFSRVMIVSLTLIAFFSFQIRYLANFDVDQRVSLFYLPAAVITLSALTLRYHAIIGIFLGYGAINLYFSGNDILSALILSLTPAIVTAATIALMSLFSYRIDKFFSPTSTLADIDAYDILLFCTGYGIINASLHHILFYFDPKFGTPVSLRSVVEMMFGDLTGSFLGFVILNLSFSILSRILRQIKTGKQRA
jgi:hypothetical protein